MKALFLIALLLTSSFAQREVELRALFSTWKELHNKNYEVEEEEYRYKIFVSNYDYIQEYNSAGNTATLGLNTFADLTNDEFASLYTGSLALPNAEVVNPIENIEYPSDWNWYPQAVTGIKNQGQCGSCWAFSSVAVSESAYYFTSGNLVSFSEQQVVDCNSDNDGCNGGYPQYALQYIAQNGLEYSSDYPYDAVQGACQYNSGEAISTSVTGSNTLNAVNNPGVLYQSIYQQPTVVLVEADQQAFQLYSSGILSQGCGTALDHAVTAVGYSADYFIIKNSWGTGWGQSGFVWISSDPTINNGAGACGILSQPVAPTF